MTLTHCRTVVALCAVATLLLACDSKKPPVTVPPPAPKAGQEARVSVSASPISSAQAQEIRGNRAFVRKVHVPQAGETALASLEPLLGKYPQDQVRFLETGVLAQRLQALMGDQYATLVKNLGTVGPLSREGEVWSIIGNRPHEGGSEGGAVVIDPVRNAVRVWLLHDGTQSEFTDLASGDIPWPPDVKKTMANVMSPTASR